MVGRRLQSCCARLGLVQSASWTADRDSVPTLNALPSWSLIMKPQPPFFESGKREPSQFTLSTSGGGRAHFCGFWWAVFISFLAGLDSTTSIGARWMIWHVCRIPSPAFALFLASHQAYSSIITLRQISSFRARIEVTTSYAERFWSSMERISLSKAALQHWTTCFHLRKQCQKNTTEVRGTYLVFEVVWAYSDFVAPVKLSG